MITPPRSQRGSRKNPITGGGGASVAHKILPLGRNGTLSAVDGTLPFVVPETATILGIRAVLGTSPTGGPTLVDIKKNGTTIWATHPANRPSIAAGATDSGGLAVPDDTGLSAGDKLILSVVAGTGNTSLGADLGVTLLYQ